METKKVTKEKFRELITKLAMETGKSEMEVTREMEYLLRNKGLLKKTEQPMSPLFKKN